MGGTLDDRPYAEKRVYMVAWATEELRRVKTLGDLNILLAALLPFDIRLESKSTRGGGHLRPYAFDPAYSQRPLGNEATRVDYLLDNGHDMGAAEVKNIWRYYRFV